MTWRKLWLLFTVIWVVVSGLNAVTILAFSPEESEKAWRPAIVTVVVPALFYVLGVAWEWFRKRRPPSRGTKN